MNELKISSKKISDILKRRNNDIVSSINYLLKFGNKDKFEESTYESRGRIFKEYLISKDGIELLINKVKFYDESEYKSIIKELELLYRCKLKHKGLVYVRDEIIFKDGLLEVCEMLDIEVLFQHSVGKYKVDFYIPSIDYVIEYDEPHHKSMIEEDLEREEFIKRELRCDFLRLDSDENIMVSTYRVVNLIQNERLKSLVSMGKDRTYHYLTMGLN